MARLRAIAISLLGAAFLLGSLSTSAHSLSGSPTHQHGLWVARYDSGAAESANDIAESPDGATVFVTGGSAGYSTVAYDAANGDQRWVASKRASYGTATTLVVSPDGRKLFVSGSRSVDVATIAYDATTGAGLWVAAYPGEDGVFGEANDVAVTPDGTKVVVTGTQDDSWYGSSYQVTAAYATDSGAQLWAGIHGGDYGAGNDVEVSPDGTTAFVAGQSGTDESGVKSATYAYSMVSGATLWTAEYGYYASAQALGVSPDGGTVFVATGSYYTTLAYDAATGVQLWAASSSTYGYPAALEVSPDGATVYVAGYASAGTAYDYVTLAYDAETGLQLWQATFGQPDAFEYAWDLGVSPDGAEVFVTGQGSNATNENAYVTLTYAADTGVLLRKAELPHGSARALAVSADGSALFVTGTRGLYPHTDYGTVAYDLMP